MSSHLEEMASFITQWDLCTCMEQHNNTSCTILFATARASGRSGHINKNVSIWQCTEAKVICSQLELTCWRFDWMLQSSSERKWTFNRNVAFSQNVAFSRKVIFQAQIGKKHCYLASFMWKPTEKPLKVESVLFTSMPTLLLGGTRHAPIMLE